MTSVPIPGARNHQTRKQILPHIHVLHNTPPSTAQFAFCYIRDIHTQNIHDTRRLGECFTAGLVRTRSMNGHARRRCSCGPRRCDRLRGIGGWLNPSASRSSLYTYITHPILYHHYPYTINHFPSEEALCLTNTAQQVQLWFAFDLTLWNVTNCISSHNNYNVQNFKKKLNIISSFPVSVSLNPLKKYF